MSKAPVMTAAFPAVVLLLFHQINAHSNGFDDEVLNRDRRPLSSSRRRLDHPNGQPPSNARSFQEIRHSTLFSAEAADNADDAKAFDLRMPGVLTDQDDEYVCSTWKTSLEDSYITQFEALTKEPVVHHMLLYGCEEPGTRTEAVWKQCYSPCRKTLSNNIVFAWARNGPPTQVPKDVGFQIGGHTTVRYLVLQIHYKLAFQANQLPDYSGLRITVTMIRPKFKAGILIMLVNSLVIPAHSKKTYGNVSCVFDEDEEFHPFGFRVHTHQLGRVVSGYLVHNGTWNLIGKGNPHWPQVFYPVTNDMVIKKSDILVARCIYEATRTETSTRIGPAQDDEMCNFYIMYYTNASNAQSFSSCSGNNIPDVVQKIPSDSDTPLPANPDLDDVVEEELSGTPREHHRLPGKTSRSRNDDQPDGYDGGGNHGGGGDGGGGGMESMGRGFKNAGSSGYDGRGPYFYSNYDSSGNSRTKSKSQRQTMDDAVQWTDAETDQQRDPAVDYVNDQRPEDVIYDYVPDKEYRQEVVRQRSRYRNRYPTSRPKPGAYNPASRYGLGMPPSRVNEDDGEQGRRMLYQDYAEAGSQGIEPGLKRVSEDSRRDRIELPRFNKSRNYWQLSSQQTTSASSDDNGGRSFTNSAMNIVKDWPQLGELALGEVTGVAADTSGNVYVFHRGSRHWTHRSFDINNRYRYMSDGPIPENTILVLSSDTGQILGQWGRDRFYLPLGLTVDQSNHVWVTDIALHQVMRFQMPETQKPDLTLGVRFEPEKDKFHFCQPTSVAVSTSGSFYVADGFCNNRIIKFSRDGDYIKEWGERSKSVLVDGFPASSTFDVVHSLTILEDRQMICAADRENSRVQCFNLDNGQFIRQLHPPQLTGRTVAVSYCSSSGLLYVINGQDSYRRTQLGIFTFDPSSGRLLNVSQLNGVELYRPQGLSTSPDCRFLYVAHIDPNRVWKIQIDNDASTAAAAAGVPVVSVSPTSPFVQAEKVMFSGGNIIDKSLQIVEDGKPFDEETDFGVSLAIGGLLVVPVSTIAIITLLIRLQKSGKCRLLSHRCRNRRYSLSSLFNRRGGSALDRFDRLRTDDNANHDELEHLHINSDSDIDDVTTAKHLKA